MKRFVLCALLALLPAFSAGQDYMWEDDVVYPPDTGLRSVSARAMTLDFRKGLRYVVTTAEFYTPAARMDFQRNIRTHEEMALLIRGQVEWLNHSFAKSGADVFINLVYVGEIDCEDSYDSDANLLCLWSNQEVSRIRDEYGADLVGGWFSKGSGRGQLPCQDFECDGAAFHTANSAVIWQDFGMTFLHEIGHNLNMHHDWFVEPPFTGDVYPFRRGHNWLWEDVENGLAICYGTIMSYGNWCVQHATRTEKLDIFSNDEIMYDGMPTGVEGVADNALMANIAAPHVANYRPGGPYAVCYETEGNLCLNGGRFNVNVRWFAPDGRSGHAGATRLTGDTGYFWFFDKDNVELVLKVLDGRKMNENFWVIAAGLTNVEVEVTVTDTETGEVRVYENPQGRTFRPIQDTAAFWSPPDVSESEGDEAPTEGVTSNLLSLKSERFLVSASWEAADGRVGQAYAVPLTEDTGYFWFFGRNNVELVVKILDGRGLNDNFWVFAGGLTNVFVEITVLDTETGEERIYTNPQGSAFEPIQDTAAFPDL